MKDIQSDVSLTLPCLCFLCGVKTSWILTLEELARVKEMASVGLTVELKNQSSEVRFVILSPVSVIALLSDGSQLVDFSEPQFSHY